MRSRLQLILTLSQYPFRYLTMLQHCLPLNPLGLSIGPIEAWCKASAYEFGSAKVSASSPERSFVRTLWVSGNWALKLMIVSLTYMAIVLYVRIATRVGFELFFTLKIISRLKYYIHQIPHSGVNLLGLNTYCVQRGKITLTLPQLLDRQLVKLLRFTCSNYSHKIIMGDWNSEMLV